MKVGFSRKFWDQLHNYLLAAYDASATIGCQRKGTVTEEMVRQDFKQHRQEKKAAHDIENT